MASTLIEMTSTTLTTADVSFEWCKRQDTDATVDTTGFSLVHRGGGFYKLSIPNVTAASDFKLYVTATPADYAAGVLLVESVRREIS